MALLIVIMIIILTIITIVVYSNMTSRLDFYQFDKSPSLLGSDKCTWGPSYWCASEANAKECNYPFASCIDYEKVD